MTECTGQNCSCREKQNKFIEEFPLDGLKLEKQVNRHKDNYKEDRLNYKAEKVQKNVFQLEGLDCADCAAKLEKRVNTMAGVQKATINFGASKITVWHTTGVQEIIRTVKEAGYDAEMAGNLSVHRPKPLWRDPKVILTTLSGFCLTVGFASGVIGVPERIVVAFLIASMLSGGSLVFKSAFYSLKSFSLDMNVLMSIAAIGAVAIGEWFEGATVVFLFSLGNILQAYSMEKTRTSIRKLMELSPQEALVKRNGQETMLSVESIVVGDIIIVKPGERIAMDGIVTQGTSMVNQSPITGESMPVEKNIGDEVFAGTINHEGALEIEVTKLVQDTTLVRIINMVEEAQAQRAPSQQFVDVFAKYYTPAVIITAVAIVVIPYVLLGWPLKPWLEKSLILLVIACPCALVISTPVSIVSAIGSAARKGVLIKGGAYLEKAGAMKVMAFDKTGTLTEGRPEVTDVVPLSGCPKQTLLEIAAAVENRSQHPVARAIMRYTDRMGIIPQEIDKFQSFTGKGTTAIVNGKQYYIGSGKLFNDLKFDLTEIQKKITDLQIEGKTAMLVGSKEGIIGILAVADQIRNNSVTALQKLKKSGIKKLVMLTGDNNETARAISAELGSIDFKSELLPEDKLNSIKELRKTYGKVAMIGDGVNDAPAMATADIGIAMGGAGTDTALETADIALMSDDLAKLPYTIGLSRQALRIIKQNITFALLVKAVFIAGTFWGFTNLWMAVFADTGASMIVIANGMRLMRYRLAK